MDLGLAGRTFVTTGSSRGLGRAVTDELVAEGANVVIASRDADRAREVATDLGDQAHGVRVDLRDPAAGVELAEEARNRFGALDGALVNHWGPPSGAALEVTDEAVAAALDLGVAAVVRLVRDIGTRLQEGGAMLVVGSVTVREPADALVGSTVSRPGAWAYIKQASRPLGERGVRVNMLLPGAFATERLRELSGGVAGDSAFVRDVPLGRAGRPEEFGRVGAFLLSPMSSYVTGASLVIDGGSSRSL
ncbi:3-oxoacyl-[acyl-carrier protein] reductase [Euzebya pacifica]|uniref:3-oxoacyl-[acyl-carrier protein] reductase n=1 Tax=Euzebya pacifica TaxID=1608957 RepID=A0A346XWT8_9ACTN|nr:SDR family oxidoreductase [Euzebya pacifica]AXV06685.1 3-oxoacyl-[acyl-carrier protein] reductase [Euzebya pacifica]